MSEGGVVLMEGLHDASLDDQDLDLKEVSDCKIICGPYTFHVHRIILMTQSKWFRAALKQNTFKEGKDRVITLKALSIATEDQQDQSDVDESCDDPEMIKRMIEYFYHLGYDLSRDADGSSSSTTSNDQAPIVTDAKMFAVAVKYHVDGLRLCARVGFQNALATAWNSDAFPEAVNIVFTSTPEDATELREIVLDTIHDHFPTLKKKPAIEEAICSIPRLTYAMLERKCDYRPVAKQTEFQCAVCHQSKTDMSPAVLKICGGCKNTPQIPTRTRR